MFITPSQRQIFSCITGLRNTKGRYRFSVFSGLFVNAERPFCGAVYDGAGA